MLETLDTEVSDLSQEAEHLERFISGVISYEVWGVILLQISRHLIVLLRAHKSLAERQSVRSLPEDFDGGTFHPRLMANMHPVVHLVSRCRLHHPISALKTHSKLAEQTD